MAVIGSTPRSKDDTAPRVPAGPARRPFSSTSVRLAPMPRSESVLTPTPPWFFHPVNEDSTNVCCAEPSAIGERCTSSATSGTPSSWASSVYRTSTGKALE